MAFSVLYNVSGFTNYVQQYVCTDSTDEFMYLANTGYSFEGNRGYQLSFKYKSNTLSYVQPSEDELSCFAPSIIPINTGTPATFTTGITILESSKTGNYLKFGIEETSIGDYLMIDEVNLYRNTTPNYPVCSTRSASNYTTSTVQINGLVNPYGASTTVTFEYVTGSTHSYPGAYTNTVTATESPVTGINDVNVSYPITYIPGRYYYYRVKATNAYGTTTGNHYYYTLGSYFKAPTSPEIIYVYPINHTNTGITLRGYVTPYCISTTVEFEWGTSTSYGNTISAIESPSSSCNNSPFTAVLTGLNTGTTYHYRVKATNGLGTTYSSDYTFVTWTIGLQFSGGTIFYFNDASHRNGIISSNQDQNSATAWGCTGTTIGTTSYNIGTGSGNTIDIVTDCTESGIAAKICYDLSLSGYTDWWLPSVQELSSMLTYKSYIGGFTTGTQYWSSTEFWYDNTNAMYCTVPSSGSPSSSSSSKNATARVRAIRYYNL